MAINRITAAMLGTTNLEQDKYVLATNGRGDLYWTEVKTTGADIPLSWPDDSSLYPTGAINYWTEETNVTTAIDDLNELASNIINETAVSNVDFTADPIAGGAGTAVTLTITADGNPNRYTINWGDGNTTTGTADSTPTHTYASNVGSPYSVSVTAYNANGTGAGSTVSKERDDYIIIYTADPVVNYSFYRDPTGGIALSGNDLYVIEGNSLYMDNNTSNINSATVDYTMTWGDGTADTSIANNSASGGTAGSRLQHTWAIGTSTGSSTDATQLTLNSHSTADPAVIPTSGTVAIKVYNSTPTAPAALSTKIISYNESVGINPRLAVGFTDNTPGAIYVAGDDVNRTTTAFSGDVETTPFSTYAYDGNSGTLTALVNGSNDGTIALSSGSNVGTNGSAVVTAESDYNLLDANGSTISFANSIYYPGAFTGFKAKVSKNTSGIDVGVNSFQLSHSTTGDTNVVEFVKDNLTATPTVDVSSATLAENSAGTYRYISGIPYYNSGSPSLTLSGVTVSNLVGQCYTNQSGIVEINDGTKQEGTAADAVVETLYSYADIDGATTMLSGGIPKINIGTSAPYAIGDLTIPITSSTVRTISRVKVLAKNVNGTSDYSDDVSTVVQVHKSAQTGVNEIAIPVSDDLGNGTYTDDGVRFFNLGAETTNTPAFDSAVNYYTNNVYTELSDPGVSGTQEATVRLGVLTHDITDYSSGYLPTGPDRSGDTGVQYFTFAFRRQAVANFSLRIISTTGISGCWIAAPNTAIDNTSTLNGWLDASIQYAGAGVPGANTAAGGNGSNGCALTGADRIISGNALNGYYTMTLGTENMSNSTGNVVIVRLALDSGENITTLEVAEGNN
jgi:hypothetical protein